MVSSEASNFGTFLLGFTSVVASCSAFIYFWRFRREGRLEKLSNIAEDSLIKLEQFEFQVKRWIIISSSTSFIYSRYSKENKRQWEESSEKKKEELNQMFETDPYEVHNHCKNLKEMMPDFYRAKSRASHLEDQVLDKCFESLEKLLLKFPIKLFACHRLQDSHNSKKKREIMARSSKFIEEDGLKEFEDILSKIKPRLKKALLYKK